MLCAVAAVAFAAPVSAKDASKAPVLSIDEIAAHGLLSSVEEIHAASDPRLSIVDAERAGLLEQPAWRLERDGDPATGKRAKLSLPIGSTTIFAVGGKLARRTGSTMPDPVQGPSPLTSRKMDSGKMVGAGVERNIGPVQLSASYQFSRVSAGDGIESDGHAKSHSLRATARIRFRR